MLEVQELGNRENKCLWNLVFIHMHQILYSMSTSHAIYIKNIN